MLEYTILIVMLCSLFFTTLYGKPKVQAYGWLAVTVCVAVQVINMYVQGKYIIALFNLGVIPLDFYLYKKWMKEYKKTKFDNREKFLKEITEKRKRYIN